MCAQTNQSPDPATVKVVEETLTVDTVRKEVGALRVHVQDEQHEQPVTLERTEERIVAERVDVNRPVERRQDPWYEHDMLVVPVYAEVPVVQRQLVLVAEIRLRRQTTQSSTTSTVTLTRQRAVVERRRPDGSWVTVDPVSGSP
jgi:stress response protein YsnF